MFTILNHITKLLFLEKPINIFLLTIFDRERTISFKPSNHNFCIQKGTTSLTVRSAFFPFEGQNSPTKWVISFEE
jgi:hypothetical protein